MRQLARADERSCRGRWLVPFALNSFPGLPPPVSGPARSGEEGEGKAVVVPACKDPRGQSLGGLELASAVRGSSPEGESGRGGWRKRWLGVGP